MPEVSLFSDDSFTFDISAAADPNFTGVTKLLYSRREASWSIGLSLRSLDGLVASGQLKTRKMGRRIMVPASELEKFALKDHMDLGTDTVT
ncbi:hypothetical protein [Tunturiibacter gelidoferens]|uniref:Helix-turn-helix domain-containing protein n=1 Tax=Tunturiibacter gelidiferens TaxID=3069689 RepID=A0A9X0QK60_9BACT|nr:hypothetical protein [Edaphobacter lichenicola]MBB5331798.1 hypothetical protein [Edaphobacter lichenicola]